jgi:hypothetical protein
MSDASEKRSTIRRSTANPQRLGQREAKVLRLSQAFEPSDPSDWTIVPETVQDALDLLATGAATSSGGGSHASWYDIEEDQEVTVEARKQSIIHGLFYQDGVLLVEGILILEP